MSTALHPGRVLLLGGAIGACSVGLSAVLHGADLRAEAAIVVPWSWVWGMLALAGTWWLRREHVPTWLLVVIGATARIPLVGTPPLLSDDLYRYLWEGLALNEGLNPFLHAPARIRELDEALVDKVNHGEISSIYPPVALLWFRLLASVGTDAWIAQIATAATDLVVVFLVAETRRARGLESWPALLYALHPLPSVESAHGAHLDVVAVMFTALAVAARSSGHEPLAALATMLGAGTKLLPGLLLPSVVRGARSGWRVGAATLAGLVVVVALALPVAGAGPALWTGWSAYSRHWAFNGLLFPWLAPVLGGAARPVLVAAGAAVVAWAWLKLGDPARVWLAVASAFVLLSPTVHPWYALWPVVPSLLLGSWGWSAASIFLLGSYAVLATYDPVSATWTESGWLWWITWPPAVACLVAEPALRRHRRNEPTPTAA